MREKLYDALLLQVQIILKKKEFRINWFKKCFPSFSLYKIFSSWILNLLVQSFQDISFFDEETIGDLTSRLGADCQQVSRVFGNDLNLIARNVVQVACSMVYFSYFIVAGNFAILFTFLEFIPGHRCNNIFVYLILAPCIVYTADLLSLGNNNAYSWPVRNFFLLI